MTIFDVYKDGFQFIVVCTRDDGTFYGEVFNSLDEVKHYIMHKMKDGDEWYYRW